MPSSTGDVAAAELETTISMLGQSNKHALVLGSPQPTMLITPGQKSLLTKPQCNNVLAQVRQMENAQFSPFGPRTVLQACNCAVECVMPLQDAKTPRESPATAGAYLL